MNLPNTLKLKDIDYSQVNVVDRTNVNKDLIVALCSIYETSLFYFDSKNPNETLNELSSRFLLDKFGKVVWMFEGQVDGFECVRSYRIVYNDRYIFRFIVDSYSTTTNYVLDYYPSFITKLRERIFGICY